MKVLFVCEGNMMRSQMAEAFYNQMTDTKNASSAGAMAAGFDHISERAAIALDEVKIGYDGQYSKQLTPEMIEHADKVVLFPNDSMPGYALISSKAELWDVIDPHYHQECGMELVREVRDDIYDRVRKLLESD